MAGYGKLAVGVILIIIAMIFLIFAAQAAITYADGVPKVEDKKDIRDQMKKNGEDTSVIDKVIKDDEETLRTKEMFMAGCGIGGVILIIIGLIINIFTYITVTFVGFIETFEGIYFHYYFKLNTINFCYYIQWISVLLTINCIFLELYLHIFTISPHLNILS